MSDTLVPEAARRIGAAYVSDEVYTDDGPEPDVPMGRLHVGIIVPDVAEAREGASQKPGLHWWADGVEVPPVFVLYCRECRVIELSWVNSDLSFLVFSEVPEDSLYSLEMAFTRCHQMTCQRHCGICNIKPSKSDNPVCTTTN